MEGFIFLFLIFFFEFYFMVCDCFLSAVIQDNHFRCIFCVSFLNNKNIWGLVKFFGFVAFRIGVWSWESAKGCLCVLCNPFCAFGLKWDGVIVVLWLMVCEMKQIFWFGHCGFFTVNYLMVVKECGSIRKIFMYDYRLNFVYFKTFPIQNRYILDFLCNIDYSTMEFN